MKHACTKHPISLGIKDEPRHYGTKACIIMVPTSSVSGKVESVSSPFGALPDPVHIEHADDSFAAAQHLIFLYAYTLLYQIPECSLQTAPTHGPWTRRSLQILARRVGACPRARTLENLPNAMPSTHAHCSSLVDITQQGFLRHYKRPRSVEQRFASNSHALRLHQLLLHLIDLPTRGELETLHRKTHRRHLQKKRFPCYVSTVTRFEEDVWVISSEKYALSVLTFHHVLSDGHYKKNNEIDPGLERSSACRSNKTPRVTVCSSKTVLHGNMCRVKRAFAVHANLRKKKTRPKKISK